MIKRPDETTCALDRVGDIVVRAKTMKITSFDAARAKWIVNANPLGLGSVSSPQHLARPASVF